jgi:hypothetical protein
MVLPSSSPKSSRVYAPCPVRNAWLAALPTMGSTRNDNRFAHPLVGPNCQVPVLGRAQDAITRSGNLPHLSVSIRLELCIAALWGPDTCPGHASCLQLPTLTS